MHLCVHMWVFVWLLHGQVRGEGLGLHTVRIRRLMTLNLICGVEGGAGKPDARSCLIFHSISYPGSDLSDR